VSLHPQSVGPVPDDTARVARAAFPRGNPCLRLRDELGTLFSDEDFTSLFPSRGQPAEAPWRLMLVSLLQYAENLSDRQAAEAVRSRIDWKYLLGLELTDAGFDSTVLSEFRSRLIAGSAEEQILHTLLEKCREQKWLTARGRQRTDSTHVLGVIRALNRLECVGETLRYALNSLAVVAPDWLKENSQPEWVDRYGKRVDDYHLPKSKDERQAYACLIGTDGYQLLDVVYAADAPTWLAHVPAVEILRRVWVQQFYRTEREIRWRTEPEGYPPCLLMIGSPYDPQAHYAKKHTTSWVGYKVHLTESCEDEMPHLITHVETTAAPTGDGDAVPLIHEMLKEQGLLPDRHLVDTGYVDAERLVESKRDYGVDLYGPARGDQKRQAREAKGFAAGQFQVDWEQQQVTCPQGCVSNSWTPAQDRRGNPLVKIKFSSSDCRVCPSLRDCTHTTRPRRTMTIHPQPEQEALVAARQRQREPEFAEQYGKRAGIEGTISQGVRAFGLRRARYLGQAKTHLQHILIATSMNLVRISQWLAGERPAQTRQSRFVALMQPCVT
jgi:transposase